MSPTWKRAVRKVVYANAFNGIQTLEANRQRAEAMLRRMPPKLKERLPDLVEIGFMRSMTAPVELQLVLDAYAESEGDLKLVESGTPAEQLAATKKLGSMCNALEHQDRNGQIAVGGMRIIVAAAGGIAQLQALQATGKHAAREAAAETLSYLADDPVNQQEVLEETDEARALVLEAQQRACAMALQAAARGSSARRDSADGLGPPGAHAPLSTTEFDAFVAKHQLTQAVAVAVGRAVRDRSEEPLRHIGRALHGEGRASAAAGGDGAADASPPPPLSHKEVVDYLGRHDLEAAVSAALLLAARARAERPLATIGRALLRVAGRSAP